MLAHFPGQGKGFDLSRQFKLFFLCNYFFCFLTNFFFCFFYFCNIRINGYDTVNFSIFINNRS